MTKHTPGPWYLDGHVRATDPVVSNVDYQVAVCITHPNPESATANARLIAAAPELYEVAQAIIDAMTADHSLHGVLLFGIAPRARAAIAKATGEPK